MWTQSDSVGVNVETGNSPSAVIISRRWNKYQLMQMFMIQLMISKVERQSLNENNKLEMW